MSRAMHFPPRKIASKILFTVLLLAFSSIANAGTYHYIGEKFDSVSGDYTTSMSVTGSFTIVGAIPANTTNFDLTPLIQSWTFSDGLTTLTEKNGTLNGTFPSIPPPTVSTDNSGNIISAALVAWSLPLATSVGDVNDAILIHVMEVEDYGFPHDYPVAGAVCSQVADGVCTTYGGAPLGSVGVSHSNGTWSYTSSAIKNVNPAALLMILNAGKGELEE